MCRQALDIYDAYPEGMLKYLRHNGWHFNKKAFEYACHYTNTTVEKEAIDKLLASHNIILKNNIGHDYLYVAMLCKSDHQGSAIEDDKHTALFIKDVIDDIDAGDGEIMRCWYAKMIARGILVDWNDIC